MTRALNFTWKAKAACLAAFFLVACSLNPQPEPPGSEEGSPGSFKGSGENQGSGRAHTATDGNPNSDSGGQLPGNSAGGAVTVCNAGGSGGGQSATGGQGGSAPAASGGAAGIGGQASGGAAGIGGQQASGGSSGCGG